MHVITLTSLSALPRARALARSLSRHQPDWSHELLLVASADVARSVAEAEGTPGLRSVCQELDLDLEALLALHDEADLTTLLLPSLLASYAARSAEPVLHLPSSVWVLGELDPIESALAARGVLLVPRLTADVPEDGLEPSREQMERTGRIEETIMAVEGASASNAFLGWWRAHVEQTLGSLDARSSGERPEDRPWLARFL